MIDPATIVQLLRAEGRAVVLNQPPTFIEDVDGSPLGLDPGECAAGTLGPVVLTADEWEAVARYLLTELDNQEGTTP